MRVIYLTSSESLSGGSRQALYLAQGLAGRGHETFLLTPAVSSLPDQEAGGEAAFRAVALPAKRGCWRAAVEQLLPAHDTPFVLHAFHNKACKLASWWGLRWRLAKRRAVVVLNRGVCYRPGNPLPWWSPGVDAVSVNSRACADVLARIGAPRAKLRVIYNGVPEGRVRAGREPLAVRAELGIAPDALVIGSITGDKPVKGVEQLVRAAALAKTKGLSARLVLVGTNPAKWGPLARELNVADLFAFILRTPHVADYLGVFDAFVISSLSESLPNTLLEACLAGLPVLSTAVGGIPELIEGRGILVPPGDASALAEGLLRLERDHEARARFAAASRELSATFTIERKVDEVEALYRELLARRGFSAD